jgi:deoxyadenosine/deoxycytidine kinase
MTLVYSVEGSIGAGKSTFLRDLQAYVDRNDGLYNKVLIVPEPIEEWTTTELQHREMEIMSPLAAFYDQPEENAAIFQMYVMFSRVMALRRAVTRFVSTHGHHPRIIFAERFGGLADEEVFVRVLCERGLISIHQYEMYKRVYNFLLDFQIDYDDLRILYVQAPFNTTRVRIAERDREAERTADTGHVLRIYNRYEAWLGNGGYHTMPSGEVIPVIRVDNGHERHRMVDEIRNLFQSELCLQYIHTRNNNEV